MKLLTVLAAAALAAAELPSAAKLREATAELARLTRIAPKRAVAVHQMTRDELKQYLERRTGAVSPKSIRDEELAMKWLGLAPPDFNLRQSSVDLMTEQAAAFYDYRKRKLVLLANPLGEFDSSVLVHELAHAIADQHFRIGRFMNESAATDDAALARMAVVEGQASWLMTEHQLRRDGRGSLFTDGSLLPQWSSLDGGNRFAFPVLDKAPLYVRVTLLFPYWEGARFQQAVVERDGARAFRRVFEQPPRSSSEILHPELYLRQEPAASVSLPSRVPRTRTLSEGTFGELDHLVVFAQAGIADRQRLAQAWRAGAYRVSETKDYCCLVDYTSLWATDADAEAAAAAWKRHSDSKALRGTLHIERRGRTVIALERKPNGSVRQSTEAASTRWFPLAAEFRSKAP